MEQSLCCPVCRANFRGTQKCSRCGADLTTLMILSAKARLCRKDARNAICSGEFEKAHDLATEVQKIHATQTGRRLWLLTLWLNGNM